MSYNPALGGPDPWVLAWRTDQRVVATRLLDFGVGFGPRQVATATWHLTNAGWVVRAYLDGHELHEYLTPPVPPAHLLVLLASLPGTGTTLLAPTLEQFRSDLRGTEEQVLHIEGELRNANVPVVVLLCFAEVLSLLADLRQRYSNLELIAEDVDRDARLGPGTTALLRQHQVNMLAGVSDPSLEAQVAQRMRAS